MHPVIIISHVIKRSEHSGGLMELQPVQGPLQTAGASFEGALKVFSRGCNITQTLLCGSLQAPVR